MATDRNRFHGTDDDFLDDDELHRRTTGDQALGWSNFEDARLLAAAQQEPDPSKMFCPACGRTVVDPAGCAGCGAHFETEGDGRVRAVGPQPHLHRPSRPESSAPFPRGAPMSPTEASRGERAMADQMRGPQIYDVDATVRLLVTVNDPTVITRCVENHDGEGNPQPDERGGGGWRNTMYDLRTPEDVMAHLLWNHIVNDIEDIRRLDGWADVAEDAVTFGRIEDVTVDWLPELPAPSPPPSR